MIESRQKIAKYNLAKEQIFAAFLCCAIFFQISMPQSVARRTSKVTATPDSFSKYVVKVAKSQLPNLTIEPTDSPFVLKINNDGKISLDNLYKRVRTLKSRRQIENEVRDFLGVMADMPPQIDVWDDVKSRIRPQIFPKEYLKDEQMKNLLVYKPLSFTQELLEGYVIDSERAFQYINNKHLKKWSIDLETVRKTAYENLNDLTKSTRLRAKYAQGKYKEGKFLKIQVSDGYAAARLLLPQIRTKIESKLGKPCYVAIPNRDLLIAWSYDFSQKKKFQRQVIRQFHFRDHPLSPKVYAIINSQIEDKSSIDEEKDLDQSDEEKDGKASSIRSQNE